MKLTPANFFFDFFPSAYVCAMGDGGGQFEGRVITPSETTPYVTLDITIKIYQELNKQRNNIFFTPNGAKTAEGRNSLSNLKQINAWWIDIDIPSTKTGDMFYMGPGIDAETMKLREEKKAEILGFVFGKDPWPSLTIETRNGYQLYWLNDGSATQDNFLKIGHSIYEHFKLCGADKSTVKVMQLMRVPNFYYIKHGEIGKITVNETLSTFEKYSEARMLEAFPPQTVYDSAALLTMERKVSKPRYKRVLGDPKDIFVRVINMPIEEVLMKISKHWIVNGDEIVLQKQDTDRSNVIVNGKGSPNFVVRSRNHIYSNNADTKGPTIVQYLRWYWPQQDAKIAEGLKQIFTTT